MRAGNFVYSLVWTPYVKKPHVMAEMTSKYTTLHLNLFYIFFTPLSTSKTKAFTTKPTAIINKKY